MSSKRKGDMAAALGLGLCVAAVLAYFGVQPKLIGALGLLFSVLSLHHPPGPGS